MAENATLRLHPRRFLVAAVSATVAFAATMVIDVARPEFEIPHVLYGGARTVCAVLWIYWFVAYVITLILRAIGPDSAGYVAGYVDGVSRRKPSGKVDYLGR